MWKQLFHLVFVHPSRLVHGFGVFQSAGVDKNIFNVFQGVDKDFVPVSPDSDADDSEQTGDSFSFAEEVSYESTQSVSV